MTCPEWHSDKPFLHGGDVAVFVGDDAHFVAWAVEELVLFGAAFSGSGFGAVGAPGEGVLGDVVEHSGW